MFSSPSDCDIVGLMTADSAPPFLFSLAGLSSLEFFTISDFLDFEARFSEVKELCPVGCPAPCN
uniref:Uncharacterized protein n=1 Tax=Arundo donax TaxID=35708 RepID=A0A0A9EWK4_ARUDO